MSDRTAGTTADTPADAAVGCARGAAEAGTVLGINPSTARSRLASARTRLRAILAPDAPSTPSG